MEPITLFLTALGLSMDAFAVSVSNGLCYKNFKKREALFSSLSFGIFQGLMPTIGYFLGSLFFNTISITSIVPSVIVPVLSKQSTSTHDKSSIPFNC